MIQLTWRHLWKLPVQLFKTERCGAPFSKQSIGSLWITSVKQFGQVTRKVNGVLQDLLSFYETSSRLLPMYTFYNNLTTQLFRFVDCSRSCMFFSFTAVLWYCFWGKTTPTYSMALYVCDFHSWSEEKTFWKKICHKNGSSVEILQFTLRSWLLDRKRIWR